jgi:hypothetical protein
MKNIYLSKPYLNAMQAEINKRLENNFLNFEYCFNSTYVHDECGSFEFRINGNEYKIYTPDSLGDEKYILHYGNFYECGYSLTHLFNHLLKIQ